MASYSYIIMGEPIAWQRATPLYSGRYMYDSQKALKTIIADKIREQHGKRPMFSCPIEVQSTYYFSPPSSMIKKRADALIGKPYPQRPDLDNISKFFYDVATGILFKDDKIICRSICQKLYDRNPRSEFIITEIE